jgi:hypothetical protein
MGHAIGDSILFAFGIAISPFPIIAIVLMLLSKNAGRNSLAFAAGWVGSIALLTAVVILASGAIGDDDSKGEPSHWASIARLVFGALLVFQGVRKWASRPAPGEPGSMPKWLKSIEHTTPMKSAVLGVLICINPKCLIMAIGGGLAIAVSPASSTGKVVAAIIFVLIAGSTVTAPVALHRIYGNRAQPVLESVDRWLVANNATMMAVLLFLIGIVLIGNGISGF